MVLPTREVLLELKKLIAEVTGFEERDENFTVCEQYCLSHIIHDRYPTVDKTNVMGLLSGYSKRFYTHGMFKFSTALDSQVDLFLQNTDIFKENEQYDIEWALLSLLCALSTNVTEPRELPAFEWEYKQEPEIENFDWAEHLKQQLETNEEGYTSETSTDDYDEDDKSSLSDLQVSKLKSDDKISTKSYYQIPTTVTEPVVVAPYVEICQQADCVNLNYNVMTQIYGPNHGVKIITEKEFLNFLLRALLNGKVDVAKAMANTALSDLTCVALTGFVMSLEPILRAVKTFDDFNTNIMKLIEEEELWEKNTANVDKFVQSDTLDTPITRSVTLMLKSYNECLRKVLKTFYDQVFELHHHLNNGLELTIFKLHLFLKEEYAMLKKLLSVHERATCGYEKAEPWEIDVRLLSVLWQAMVESTTREESRVFHDLFMCCLRAYINIIESSWSLFDLEDTYKEFIVFRSGLEEHNMDLHDSYRVRPYETMLAEWNLQCPPVLDFLADEAVNLCICADIFVRLDRRSAMSDTPNVSKYLSTTFYDVLLTDTDKVLKDELDVISEPVFNSSVFEIDVLSRRLPIRAAILQYHEIIKKCLYNLMNEIATSICLNVKNILLTEFSLTKHVVLLRNVYLQNSAHLIEPVLTCLFTEPNKWTNMLSLSILLRESVEEIYPDLAHKFTVKPVDCYFRPGNVLDAIDNIYVNYEVDFPLSLIIKESHIAMYNELLKLLLKIKWAASTMSSLRFPVVNKDVTPQKNLMYNGLFLLRFSMLNALHKVNNYFLTKVSLETTFDECRHLSDLIQVHDHFIKGIHEDCLLTQVNKNVNFIIINELIPLCVDIEQMWINIDLPTNFTKFKQHIQKSIDLFQFSFRKLSNFLTQ